MVDPTHPTLPPGFCRDVLDQHRRHLGPPAALAARIERAAHEELVRLAVARNAGITSPAELADHGVAQELAPGRITRGQLLRRVGPTPPPIPAVIPWKGVDRFLFFGDEDTGIHGDASITFDTKANHWAGLDALLRMSAIGHPGANPSSAEALMLFVSWPHTTTNAGSWRFHSPLMLDASYSVYGRGASPLTPAPESAGLELTSSQWLLLWETATAPQSWVQLGERAWLDVRPRPFVRSRPDVLDVYYDDWTPAVALPAAQQFTFIQAVHTRGWASGAHARTLFHAHGGEENAGFAVYLGVAMDAG